MLRTARSPVILFGEAAPREANADAYRPGSRRPCEELDAYQEAGADAVFVPGLTDPGRIAALVRHLDVPLNILYSPTGPTVARLAGLGVRRVSLGSLLYRRALGAAVAAMAAVAAGGTPEGATPSYGEVQELSGAPHFP